jgi:hypothetical protein
VTRTKAGGVALKKTGGEGGILIRELRKPKKPNEIRLRQRAGSDFVATTVYHFSRFRNGAGGRDFVATFEASLLQRDAIRTG